MSIIEEFKMDTDGSKEIKIDPNKNTKIAILIILILVNLLSLIFTSYYFSTIMIKPFKNMSGEKIIINKYPMSSVGVSEGVRFLPNSTWKRSN